VQSADALWYSRGMRVKPEHMICWAVFKWPEDRPMSVEDLLASAAKLRKRAHNRPPAGFEAVFKKLQGHLVSNSVMVDVYIKRTGPFTYTLTSKGHACIRPVEDKLVMLENDATVRAVIES